MFAHSLADFSIWRRNARCGDVWSRAMRVWENVYANLFCIFQLVSYYIISWRNVFEFMCVRVRRCHHVYMCVAGTLLSKLWKVWKVKTKQVRAPPTIRPQGNRRTNGFYQAFDISFILCHNFLRIYVLYPS